MVELEIGFHHGCLGSDHRSPGVVKLVMLLYHKRYLRVGKLVMGLHH